MAESPQQEYIETTAKNLGAGDSTQANNEPKVPFQTQLKLTAEQEQRMIDHAFARKQAMESESGRTQSLQPTWWTNLQPTPNQAVAAQGFLQASTFMGKRCRFEATEANDVSWRPWTMGVDNIFMSSNIAVPLARRISRQMVAKAKDNFFGSDPWFGVDPTAGSAGKDETGQKRDEKVEDFAQFKLGESGTKEEHGRAIKQAINLGECAVKTSYVVRDQIFNVESEVLVDVTGEPMRDQSGNHISPDDQWEEQDDGLGNKKKVLARDHVTEQPAAPIWQKVPLDRRQVLFEGAKSEPIYFKDFLCPLTAANVQEADCICPIYDKSVVEFVDLVVKRGMVDNSTEGRKTAARKMVSLVRSISENNSQPKAAVDQAIRPNENYTPIPSSADSASPVAEFAEFYMWYDANGDGIAENIMLICDVKSRMPVYYDHVANVTTDGLRPIEIVRINPIEGRWYGMGIIELFESYQVITDLLVNRWNFSQSRSGRVDLWNPKQTLEGDREPNLKMNWGGTYTKKPGAKAEDILETVYLNDTKFEQIKTMIEFFMQLAMNESGVSNANDDQAAGMQSSKLATGILEVKKSGDELFQPIIADLKGPLERLLTREIDVTLANLNPEEVFTYLDGDTMGVDKITPDDVRGLKYKAKITLTTHKNQMVLQQYAQAAALVEKFYMLTPEVQARVASFYRDQIRALDPKVDVDNVISPVPPAPPAPPPSDALKPSLAVAAKFNELPPDVQQQLLAQIQIKEDAATLEVNSAQIAAAAAKPAPGASNGGNGSKEKLGEAKTSTKADTPFAAQLGQKHSQPKGVAAVKSAA